jgi:predicted MFS family arabinose efflux permease
LRIPDGIDPGMRAALKESIGDAFVFGFRLIMLICAGLGVVSAAVAWRMIPKRTPDSH